MVPSGYADYTMMQRMGWSWQELMNCPEDIVVNLRRYMLTEDKFDAQKG